MTNRLTTTMMNLVDVFGRCDGGLDGLQCEEAEALAAALEAFGGERSVAAARNVIRTHAMGDDEDRGDTDPSSQHHDIWHEENEGYECEAGETCKALIHDPSDDEVERQKDGS